jgi:gamma-glutamyltranspeptidase
MSKQMTDLQRINVAQKKRYMIVERMEKWVYAIIIRVVQNRAFVKIPIKYFLQKHKKQKIFKKICYNIRYTINNEFI